MKRISNYVLGQWTPHEGSGIPQYDAVSGALISTCGSEGLDYADMMHYARSVGGPALRKMTFPERGRMLKALALYLSSRKEAYYLISYQTGATRSDSWIDIDGGIGTLFAYASLRRKFTDAPYHVEGDPARLSKEGTFVGQHILSPKHGVAVHINAFNFPVWGMLEKLSVNLLAGVPAIVKPSEITSFLSEQVVRDIIGSGLLPAGALQLVCGSGIGILDPLTSQDVVTFTGSAETGRKLRAHPAVIAHSVPFNMEADSLNAIVMGDDVKAGSPEFDLFIKEVRREVTAKCGQKCTAIRRMIVPEALLEDVQIALGRELGKTTLGNPQTEGVRMGALVNKTQQAKVQKHIAELLQESELVYGSLDHFEVIGADKAHGAFMPPLILRNNDPFHHQKSHTVEAFGPVVTLMPYQSPEEAAILANMGKGSLVSTVCTADTRFARTYIMESAPYHGRILVLNRESARESTGHGSPMPQLVHGGPGRAGGGEEMGGMRGVMHYLQRTAIQGTPQDLTAITGVYQPGAPVREVTQHPFRTYFEDLVVGETLTTHKRSITESDIIQFANLSWDHFYAHTDITSLEGTPFTERVAHGYLILSAAAGLFVDPGKGPVLLNYGLEECRFVKPVYAGTTIGVRFTVKEKVDQELRSDEDIPKGIVKFFVEVYDQTGETVAVATILTMVRKRGL